MRDPFEMLRLALMIMGVIFGMLALAVLCGFVLAGFHSRVEEAEEMRRRFTAEAEKGA